MNILDNNLKALIEECNLLKNKISEQVKDIRTTVSSAPERVARPSPRIEVKIEEGLENKNEKDRKLQN